MSVFHIPAIGWNAFTLHCEPRPKNLVRLGSTPTIPSALTLRFRLLPIIPTAVLLMSISYLTWLAIVLVLAVIVALTSGRWRRLRFIAALVVFSFSFNAACCLEVATIISLENRRYMTVQMYSTLLAQLLGFWFILEFVVQMWERRRIAHASRVSGDRVPRSRTFL